MHALIILLSGLVCAQAAPQFVFVLPPEFLKQMQKPVGETSPQPGQQQPRIPFFPLESLLSSPSTLSQSVVPAAPVAPETFQAEESARVITAVVPPTDVVAEAVSETVVQAVKEEPVAEQVMPIEVTMVEEAVPIVEGVPVEKTIVEEAAPIVQEPSTEATVVEEAVPVVQEAPAEVAIMKEVAPVVQEVYTDSPAQEVTADPTIAAQISEPANMSVLEHIVPVEEVVTPAIVESVTENFAVVEEVVIVQDVATNSAQEIVIVEEVIPSTIVATTQRPVTVPTGSVPNSKKQRFSAPTNQVVDPRFSVDPRFRSYIYENDAPDVVAAKIALFNLQAASLPRQPVQ